MGDLQPRMRAGDAERHAVVEQLGTHFAQGRLTVDEFDERVVQANAAVYLDQLPALTADLPQDPPPRRRPARQQTWAPAGALVALLAVLLFSTLVIAVLEGAPVLLVVLILFLLLRHRRWSRRW